MTAENLVAGLCNAVHKLNVCGAILVDLVYGYHSIISPVSNNIKLG